MKHCEGVHDKCTEGCSGGPAKKFMSLISTDKKNKLKNLFVDLSLIADSLTRMKSTSEVIFL